MIPEHKECLSTLRDRLNSKCGPVCPDCCMPFWARQTWICDDCYNYFSFINGFNTIDCPCSHVEDNNINGDELWLAVDEYINGDYDNE